MSNDTNRAPIVRLSVIAPSLASIPEAIELEKADRNGNNNNNNNLLAVPGDKESMLSASTDKPKIPDGGWGWMVVVSCLFLSLIMDGISFSFGILFVEFVAEFGESTSTTSWIGSLFISVPLLTGPIMSALVDKYGCRKMTIVGGLVSTAGFVLSAYARSIEVMMVTFGVIAGLGLGLTFITAVVSIAFWFDKKRNLAVGLGACGIGIGTFVYAPLTAFLLREFQWRGTVLLLGGTLLNMCVCGALMRDPDWITEQNKSNKSSKLSKSSNRSSSQSSVRSVSEKINIDEIRDTLISGSSRPKNGEYILQEALNEIESKAHNQSLLNLPTYIKRNEPPKKQSKDPRLRPESITKRWMQLNTIFKVN